MLRGAPTATEAKSPRDDAPLRQRSVRRGKTRFPGLVADAKALGVSRVHLWLVLTGQRQSARLTARYEVLKAEQAAEPQT